MKVDELLEKGILTPNFACVAVKPNEGCLGLLDSGSRQLFYVKGAAPIDQADDQQVIQHLYDANCVKYENTSTNSIGLLIQFLKLAESARITDDGKRSINMNNVYGMCFRNGLPIVQTFTVQGKGRLLGFDLQHFANRLDNLYICYALWKAIQVDEFDLIKQIWPQPMSKDKMQIEFERRLLADITISVVYKDNQPILLYQAQDIMELVEAQLAVLASKGDDYLDGGCIAYCADCGQPYIKRRSNSTLCEGCKGNTGKSRRYRAKKKGDQNNG